MKNLLILVSGGRASARMAYHVHTHKKYKDFNKLYLYCNTGMEEPATIQFLKDMVKFWGIPLVLIEGVYSNKNRVGVASKVRSFSELDMSGRVFSEMISHLQKHKWTGVPNPATPYCSSYLKIRPSHHFAKNYFASLDYVKALGYRVEDMPKRITLAELQDDSTRIAPLLTDFDSPISQLDLNRFFKKQPFKLHLHSLFGNCRLCWKKDIPKLVQIIQDSNKFVQWHIDHEKALGNNFFRGNLSMLDLVKIAELGTQTVIDFKVSGESDSDISCTCNF